MKYNAATKLASIGVIGSGACAPAIEIAPMLPRPSVASMTTSYTQASARRAIDTIADAENASRVVPLTTGEAASAQHMSPINVVASVSAEPSVQALTSHRGRVTVGSVSSYAFGESEPVLTCTVLRACVIELEAAEILVDAPIAGDQARWIITTARAGKGGASTLVVVKPKACDVTTNLVLSTDRRIYDLDLDSPRCSPRDTNPKRAYTRHVRFSYPNEFDSVAIHSPSDSTAPERPRSLSVEAPGSQIASAISPPDSTLNTEYELVREPRGPFGVFGSKRQTFPWQPTRIADDGAHVYVSLPPIARKYPAPVLYALEDDGTRTIVNYVVREAVIITDRVFRRGVLVIPSGNEERTLSFENRAWNRVPPASER